MKRHIIRIFLSLTICLLSNFAVEAQESEHIVNGTVTDSDGNPLSGITVSSAYGKNLTMTGQDGKYSLDIDDGSDFVLLHAPGFISQRKPLSTKTVDTVLERAGGYDLDEIVHMGHSSQRRGDISGSVASVGGEELMRSPGGNITMALAGRLQGLFTSENYSEPSRTNTNLYSRGISSIRANQPIAIVDGMVVSHNVMQTFDYISAAEIESVTLLKDAASQALYGIQGADGVLVITTRRGMQGKLKVGIQIDQTFQQMSAKPSFFNSGEYATLRNQAASNNGLGDNFYYTADQIEKFRSGTDRNLYPDNNWRDMFLKDVSSMQRVGVNLSGGNRRVVFFSNVNVMHQGKFYETDQTAYKPNNSYFWANFRSNVDVKLNRYLTGSLRLAGNVKKERTAGGGFMDQIYPSLFTVPSSVYGPVTPRVTDPDTGDIISEGGGVIVTDKVQATPYALLNRMGYQQHTVTNVYAKFALDLDMSFLTKGLSLTGSLAYQTNSWNLLNATQSYERWIRSADTSVLAFDKYGTETNGDLTYSKSSNMYYQLTYQAMINYNRSFGRHKVGAAAYVFYQDLNTEDEISPLLLPYMRVSSGFEATYNYNDRYLVKFDVGYSGSEQYARANRFIATPAFSAAWVLSNEPFMKNARWLSYLKFRASYGKTATERSGLGRYVYLDNITLARGGTIGALTHIVTETQIANPNISAETVMKQNYGIDLSLFGNFSLTFDIFREKMDNMVIGAAASVPSYQGVPLDYLPASNSGIFENKGYEVSADYTKSFNKDLSFSVGGLFAHSKNKIIKSDESRKASDYAHTKWQEGYSYGQEFGYLIDRSNGNGYFNSQQELDNSNLVYEIGTPRVGDLKYIDVNGDGFINEKDKAPIGSGALPQYYYSFYGTVRFKGFDFSVLFQGIGKYSTTMSGPGVWEYDYDGVFGSLHREAWTQERYEKGLPINYPALSTQKNTNHEVNEFFLYDRSYLRLKNIEIGYTLPKKISRAIAAESLRISVSGQNLFTWDKMKTADFGPDAGYMSVPVYRFYNVKLSLNF